MLIQVDVDSTLYDADALFSKIAREAGICWPDRASAWLKAHEIPMLDGQSMCTLDALKKVFRKAHSAEYVMQNVPYPDAAATLGRIAGAFEHVEIAYVSDRNEQQTRALRDWLDANGFLHNEDQRVVATKDKRDWMREKKPSIVIDDRVRTMLMARYELGARVVSIQHPHNINLKGEVDGIYVVKDWKEIDRVLWEILPEIDPIIRESQYVGAQ